MKEKQWWKGAHPDLAIGVALGAVVVAAYSGVLKNGFVNFDDPFYITANPFTQHGLSLSEVTWAFTTDFASNWHPLTWLSVMLDVDLFGLEPAGHHAVSLGLHGLNTALLFAFMRRLGIGRGPSVFAAGLFGLHPLHVESVAWAAERKDVLSMAFGLLTLLAYIRYAEAPSRRRMAVVTGLLVLGLMAKPMLVTLPFVLLLLDWWPLRRVRSPAWMVSPELGPGTPGRAMCVGVGGRRLLLEKTPLFAVVLLSCVLTLLAQRGAVVERLPLASRLENGVHSYVIYLAEFVFPRRLAFYHPMVDLAAPRVAFCTATLVLVTFVTWLMRATRPYLLVGWLWFLGTLVPVIGLVQVGGQAYADRYTYLPSLGLGLAGSLALAEAVGRVGVPRRVVILAGGALLATLGVATWRLTPTWRDSVTLYEHAVAATEQNWFVRLLLAGEYKRMNDPKRAEAMLRQALTEGFASGHCAWTSTRRVRCAGGDFGGFTGSAPAP